MSSWAWIPHAVVWKCDKNVQLLMNKLTDASSQPEQLSEPHQSASKKAESLCYGINESKNPAFKKNELLNEVNTDLSLSVRVFSFSWKMKWKIRLPMENVGKDRRLLIKNN